MLYALAALTSAIVLQEKNTLITVPPTVTLEQHSLPNTTIPPQGSVAATRLREAHSVSAAMVESLLGTSATDQVLAQSGTQPSLQTEPSSPNDLPFQPNNVPLEPLQKPVSRAARSAPGVSIITPSAYGQSWGNASIGLGLQERTRFTDQADGVLGIGIGLGNPQNSIGFDIGLTFVDLIGDTAQDGTVSFKLHRRLPDDFAVAVGIKNAIRFGETDSATGYYGVVTKMFRLQPSIDKPFSRLFVSAGVGSGQFRSELDVNNDRDSVGVFGGVAMRVAEPVNAIAEWSGQDLTLGLSVTPFRDIPLVISPAITDITGNAGDGSRFILGVGYSISF